MSEERKKRIFRVAVTILGVIVAALVINKLLDSWTGVRAVGSKITSAAAPIIVGAVIAFLMNPVLVFFDRLFLTLFEDRLIKTRKKAKKVSRIPGLPLPKPCRERWQRKRGWAEHGCR